MEDVCGSAHPFWPDQVCGKPAGHADQTHSREVRHGSYTDVVTWRNEQAMPLAPEFADGPYTGG